MNEILERYGALVDDPGALRAALERPLPVCVWANTSRTSVARLEALMEAEGLAFEKLPWYPGGYRLGTHHQGIRRPDLGGDKGISPGNRVEYLAGLYYVQEEVSMLPVHFLDPQPGERILDLCAAPGNKTAQIAVRIGRQGTVVANDRGLERTSILRRNLGRLGATQCVTTIQDAAGYPETCGLFDRVLADVPCSCEGTSRKFPSLREVPRPMAPGKLAGVQVAILRKAVRLCRPGGRIVYATCTYAPEENEAVVNTVLQTAEEGSLRLLPARAAGFVSSPGLTSWQGKTYHPDLELCLRAWPHQNDTGGFFVAVLEKTEATEALPPEAWLPPQLDDAAPYFEPLTQRYGLPPEAFEGLGVYQANNRQLALLSTTLRLPRRPKVHTLGLPFLYLRMQQPKLTSSAAMLLGAAATRNVAQLDRKQADCYLHRQDLDLRPSQVETCTGNGPAIVRYGDIALGIGSLRLDGKAPHLKSLIPKGWALAKDRSAF